ncbi:MAG: hypothetical protein QM503_00195 [Bacteroidota bacterium]
MNHKFIISIIFFAGILVIQSCAVTSDDEDGDIDKYFGTWSVSDQAARLNYNATITANPSNSSEILLNNFADLNSTAVGLVVGNNIDIDNQSLGSNYMVNGSGSYINSGRLEFKFSLNDSIDIESRVAVFTK